MIAIVMFKKGHREGMEALGLKKENAEQNLAITALRLA